MLFLASAATLLRRFISIALAIVFGCSAEHVAAMSFDHQDIFSHLEATKFVLADQPNLQRTHFLQQTGGDGECAVALLLVGKKQRMAAVAVRRAPKVQRDDLDIVRGEMNVPFLIERSALCGQTEIKVAYSKLAGRTCRAIRSHDGGGVHRRRSASHNTGLCRLARGGFPRPRLDGSATMKNKRNRAGFDASCCCVLIPHPVSRSPWFNLVEIF